jgi:hypothetical protein
LRCTKILQATPGLQLRLADCRFAARPEPGDTTIPGLIRTERELARSL